MEFKMIAEKRLELLEWIRRFHNFSELPEYFTLDQLLAALMEYCAETIECEPFDLPVGLLGLTFQSISGSYIVFHQPYLTGRNRILTVTHELGHIVQGHATQRRDRQDIISDIRSGKKPHEIDGVFCKSRNANGLQIDLEKEQKAEFIGRYFERHLTNDSELLAGKMVDDWNIFSNFVKSFGKIPNI
jgi:hypothetical protein